MLGHAAQSRELCRRRRLGTRLQDGQGHKGARQAAQANASNKQGDKDMERGGVEAHAKQELRPQRVVGAVKAEIEIFPAKCAT